MADELVLISGTALQALASNPHSPEAKEARALVKANPAGALATLANPSCALSLWDSAQALDEVIGTIADPAEAREQIDQYFSSDQQEERLAVRGDLPSAAVEVLAPERFLGGVAA